MRFLALALIGAALLLPAGAGAATTIGELSSSPGMCSANDLHWQHSASAPSYATPAGVITSWSTNPGAASGFHERLIVVREGTPNTLVGNSAYESIPAGTETSFPTYIAVQSGDLIGLQSSEANAPCAFSTSEVGATMGSAPDPNPATTFSVIGVSLADLHINAKAVVETDADLSITATASAGVVNIGDNVNFTLFVKNNSTALTAQNVVVHNSLAGRFTFLSATGSGCSGGAILTCGLGSLAPGATGTVIVAARAKTPGDSVDSGSVSSDTPDSSLGDNSADARVRVQPPPFPGASVAAGTIRVRNGVGTMLASCPPEAVTSCVGTVVVSTARKVAVPSKKHARKRIVRLGSGVLGVQPGTTGKVKITITKLGRKLLAKRGSVAAVAVINSHDSLSPNKKLTANVLVKGKRAKRHRHR
jgi:uncharacterized repeat protein (TIGR01451 family)